MKSGIIADMQEGVVSLVHDLTEPVTDSDALPAEAKATVDKFVTSLGMDPAEVNGIGKGWAFDLLMKAMDSVTGASGHAQAGATAQEQAPVDDRAPGLTPIEPTQGATGAAQEATTATELATAEAAAHAAQETPHGPADTDLPPVSDPREGYEICPKCSGFRTVLASGHVEVCPLCRGAGEVPTGTPNN